MSSLPEDTDRIPLVDGGDIDRKLAKVCIMKGMSAWLFQDISTCCNIWEL
jgi:hypothetical protein